MTDMKSAAIKKKEKTRRVPRKKRTTGVGVMTAVVRQRKSRAEFSCGVDFDRALLVEETLDERERRG